MNVFVLCTGRCGSMSFARACEHLTNFSVGHESRATLLGHERLNFPDNHIEVDNRLAGHLGRLEERFGDRAFYVHLTRDPAAVVKSLMSQPSLDGSIVTAHQRVLRGAGGADLSTVAADYVETATANIAAFLKAKTNVRRIQLERINEQFPAFLEWIGAEGDLDAACREWDTRHNIIIPPAEGQSARRWRLPPVRRTIRGLISRVLTQP